MAALRSAGVRALVFEDRDDPECLGAVFPNNWFTAHREGVVVVYPMRCPSRRKERREDLVEHLRDKYKVGDIRFFSHKQEQTLFKDLWR